MNHFDITQALEVLLPPDALAKYRREQAERTAREAKLIEDMRCQLAEALMLVGESIRRPRIAREDLEQAVRHMHRALSISALLDHE